MSRERVELYRRRIGQNVSRRRRRLRLTQERLAEVIGVEPRYLQMIEQGRRSVSLTVLVALADALRLDPRRLLGVPPGAKKRKTPR